MGGLQEPLLSQRPADTDEEHIRRLPALQCHGDYHDDLERAEQSSPSSSQRDVHWRMAEKAHKNKSEWNSSLPTWEATCHFPNSRDAEAYYPWFLPFAIVLGVLAVLGGLVITHVFRRILPYFDSTLFYLFLPFVILALMLNPMMYLYHYFRLRGTEKLPAPPEHGPLKRRALTHAVVICSYKEPMEVLHRTFASIAAQEGTGKRPIAVFATEARDPERHSQAAMLEEAYGSAFDRLLVTEHVLIETEVAGKSSNENFALRELRRVLDAEGVDPFEVMVTIADADSLMSPTYLAHLEDTFYCMPDGRRTIYSGPLNTYRNLAAAGPLVQMHEISRCHADTFCSPFTRSFPLSNYSLTLGFCAEIDYWTPDNIPEDVHTNLKAIVLSYGGQTVVPIPSIISNDLVPGIQDRYIQAKRHHWGITETAYLIAVFRHMNLSFEVFLPFLQAELTRPGSLVVSCVGFVNGVVKCLVLIWLYKEWGNITDEAKHFMFICLLYIPLAWGQFWIAELSFCRSPLMKQFDLERPSLGRWVFLVAMSPILSAVSDILFYYIPILHILFQVTFVGQLKYVNAPKGAKA